MSDEPTVTVIVYLPVQYRSRKSAVVKWWFCTLAKRPDFDLSDFTPFKLVTTYAESWGEFQKVWPLSVRSLDAGRCVVVCEQESFAASKVDSFERCLWGCGWEQCAEPLALAPTG